MRSAARDAFSTVVGLQVRWVFFAILRNVEASSFTTIFFIPMVESRWAATSGEILCMSSLMVICDNWSDTALWVPSDTVNLSGYFPNIVWSEYSSSVISRFRVRFSSNLVVGGMVGCDLTRG